VFCDQVIEPGDRNRLTRKFPGDLFRA